MEFAALASFAILFVAWLVAPDGPRPTVGVERSGLEPEPVAASA